MKRNKLKIILMLLCAVTFVFSTINVAFALSTLDAKYPIDITKRCSLTLTYRVGEITCPNLNVNAFFVASIDDKNIYHTNGAFSDYPISVNGISAQSEWDDIRDTINAYITADKIAPIASHTTNEQGMVTFNDLPVGLYYISQDNDPVNTVNGFNPFMIAVPCLNENGEWIYDVNALPKPGMLPAPTCERLTLVKLWRDGNGSNRPDFVSVDIYRSGELFKSVQLTSDDNWTYEWDTNGVYYWAVVERNIPDGYNVAIKSVSGSVIQIINTNGDAPGPAPQTGDPMTIYIILAAVSLFGFMLMASRDRRHKAVDY